MRKSLTIRLFCINFICLAVPLLITSFVFFDLFYSRRLKVAREKLQNDAEHMAITMHSLEPLPMTALDDIIYFLPNNEEGARDAITSLNTKSRTIFELLSSQEREGGIYDILSESKGQEATFASSGGIEQILKKGSAAFIRWIRIEGMQMPGLVFYMGKVVKKDGEELGVLLAAKNIHQQVRYLVDEQIIQDGGFGLVNQDDVIIMSTGRKLDGQFLHPLAELERYRLKGADAIGDIVLADEPLREKRWRPKASADFIYDRVHYLAYQAQLPNMDFSIISFIPSSVIFGEAIAQFIWIYVIYGVVLAAGIVLAFVLSQWISRPMRDLTYVMNEANEGNLKARFLPRPLGYEFNRLGSMFNETLEAMIQFMKDEEDVRVEKETYLKELNLGRDVQQSLLNIQMLPNNHVEAAAIYIQAENVGGDFYCVETKEDGKYWLVVGDAAGKGISSCLYALTVRSLIRSNAFLSDHVGQILSDTNNAFLEQTDDSGMFVAALMGMYDALNKKLSYYSCGHTPGIIKRKDGALETLSHSGMALGLLASDNYEVDQIDLEPGDSVIFFTKGLIEASNNKNQYFSERHLRELLQQRRWVNAEEVVEGLKKEYHKFIGSQVQEDEVVIVALTIK